ncbi:MAG: transcription antitermination protein NusB [Rikenellaceae bacterium]
MIVEVADCAASKIEVGKNKMLPTEQDLKPNMRFVENAVVAKIRNCDTLYDYMSMNNLGWSQNQDVIKKLYAALEESDFYKEYMAAETTSFEKDMKLVQKFFVNIVQDNEAVEAAIEEQSIMWMDDLDFALIMVIRTLQGTKASKDCAILPQFKNAEDRDFVTTLFTNAVVNNSTYFEYIDKFTKNWDVDRIAFMDRVIMLATISEVMSFADIPVRVSMDEYIEISKYYSTPESSTFINGVLDKLVADLQAQGKLNKIGRGLA